MRLSSVAAAFAGIWLAGTLGVAGCAAGGSSDTDPIECAVGSEGCQCTTGGACDPGLQCLSSLCVDPNGGSGGSGNTASTTGTGPSTSSGNPNCMMDVGCQAIDVLFAIDSSMSMNEEIGSLAATQAFTSIVQKLSEVNCGDIQFRIGLTDDNDRGFITPSGWSGDPWFDSATMDLNQIASNFNGAANRLIPEGTTSPGCEHVLSSATSLLTTDITGFVREEALLVVVLVTDVDDYGSYDQGQLNCGGIPIQGCTTPPPALATLQSNLLALKNNDAAGLATIIVAGDPNKSAGFSLCGSPASCCFGSCETGAYHGSRLWQFADLLGNNGIRTDICAGAATLPQTIENAFANDIDLACKGFDPPK